MRILQSPSSARRLGAARRWLRAHAPGAEVLVLGQSLDAAHELLLDGAAESGAAFGWRRATPSLLALELARPRLASAGRAPAGGVSREAVVARGLHRLRTDGGLGRYAEVAEAPGLIRALAASLEELRFARIDADRVEAEEADLARIGRAVAAERADAGLADRADVWLSALEAARGAGASHPLLGLPTLLLDVSVRSRLEASFLAAVLERAPGSLVTVPAGDARTLRLLRDAAPGPMAAPADGPAPVDGPAPTHGPGAADRAAPGDDARGDASPDSALARLRAHLFESVPGPAPGDDTVALFSAPGEGRECVEIAREIHRLAGRGVPFDRVAVLLRSPEEYRPHLEEAFWRADVPSWFARGVRRPDPAGRAFLALLRCRADDFSAARFAEYLSMGQVPDAEEDGSPPPPRPPGDRWAPGEDEVPLSAGAGPEGSGEDGLVPRASEAAGPDAPVRHGSLRVPRRWEKLLVEASVVGGLGRWERRLDGLGESLRLRLEGLEESAADEPAAAAIRRRLEDLGHLRGFALPLLRALSGLPDRAPWAAWLEALQALATRSLRAPSRVLGLLAELAPLGPVGPVDLAEVVRVLGPRLLEVTRRPDGDRYGKVLVAPVDAARGRSFEVVFVPGLAERLFPPRIPGDPVLPDESRERLGGDLSVDRDRVAEERLALRLAAGAARRRLVLSYPRLDVVKTRPRVPSFYALEAVRASEGRLPGHDELAARAERERGARIGWPAPEEPGAAIDPAEYDLAVLERLGLKGTPAVRAAGHLLGANPHLARALRFRAYRWTVPKWTAADGLVKPEGAAAEALAGHRLEARPFSATALQAFAACPYRFFLRDVQRLSPREDLEAIESLDPLERGALVHEVQFRLLSRLQDEGLLPLEPGRLPSAHEALDEVVGTVADAYRDRLCPAIDRVWEDEVESIRADLREWVHRESRAPGPFVPWRFELGFGLPATDEGERDPRSVPEPVTLESGLRLRGSIDLLERDPSGVLRATDHKTGRARMDRDAVVGGGEHLQPALYALAAEKLFPDDEVRSGRLYYCTARGGFETREVPLDADARDAVRGVTEVLRHTLEEDRCLPAAPAEGACRWCDYLAVCGPDEERRTRRKPEVRELTRLRRLR